LYPPEHQAQQASFIDLQQLGKVRPRPVQALMECGAADTDSGAAGGCGAERG
jgi:hypothetical protein